MLLYYFLSIQQIQQGVKCIERCRDIRSNLCPIVRFALRSPVPGDGVYINFSTRSNKLVAWVRPDFLPRRFACLLRTKLFSSWMQ